MNPCATPATWCTLIVCTVLRGRATIIVEDAKFLRGKGAECSVNMKNHISTHRDGFVPLGGWVHMLSACFVISLKMDQMDASLARSSVGAHRACHIGRIRELHCFAHSPAKRCYKLQ